MGRKFTQDVSVEFIIDGNSVEVVATVEFKTSPYDSGVSSGPAELCYPPEGGEVEDAEVIALVLPGIKSSPGNSGRPEVPVDCPQWLAESIIANVSSETLTANVDFAENDYDDDYYDDRERRAP